MMGVPTDEVILLTWGPVLGVSLEAGGIFHFRRFLLFLPVFISVKAACLAGS